MVDDATLRLVAGLLLTAPYIPMLFMGEEYGETAPFPFFVSHGDMGLVERVRQGASMNSPVSAFAAFPSTQAPRRRSGAARLDVSRSQGGPGQALQRWYREVIRLRRELPALARLDRTRTEVTCRESENLLIVRRWSDGDQVMLLFHFGTQAAVAR